MCGGMPKRALCSLADTDSKRVWPRERSRRLDQNTHQMALRKLLFLRDLTFGAALTR